MKSYRFYYVKFRNLGRKSPLWWEISITMKNVWCHNFPQKIFCKIKFLSSMLVLVRFAGRLPIVCPWELPCCGAFCLKFEAEGFWDSLSFSHLIQIDKCWMTFGHFFDLLFGAPGELVPACVWSSPSPPHISWKIDFFFLSGSLNLFPGCFAVAGGWGQLFLHAWLWIILCDGVSEIIL